MSARAGRALRPLIVVPAAITACLLAAPAAASAGVSWPGLTTGNGPAASAVVTPPTAPSGHFRVVEPRALLRTSLAVPTSVTEDFETPPLAFGDAVFCGPGEQRSTTTSPCFSPGDLQPGAGYRTLNEADVMVHFHDSGTGYPGTAMGVGDTDTMVVSFDAATEHWDFTAMGLFGDPTSECRYTGFDAGGVPLGQDDLPCAPNGTQIVADFTGTPVSSMTIQTLTAALPGLDDLTFEVPAPAPVVPEAPVAVVLPLLAAGLGAYALRRRLA